MIEIGKKIYNNRIFHILFVFLVLVLGIAIRGYHLGVIPVGIHQDEAMMAVDARALEQYGTDHFGTEWPVHFEAWIGGQQSAFMDYLMALSIHFFGYSLFSIRLPMLILSAAGMVAFYFLLRWFGQLEGIVGLMMIVICPWHYMQSRWAFDCNAFPHLFLIGATLILWSFPNKEGGKNRKALLYLSMLFFGLSHYGYGIANYTVPVFLLILAIWLLLKEKVSIKEILICILIYLFIALPEIMTMAVNTFGWDSFKWGPFTIQRFPETFRSRDILFFTFSLEQLFSNIKSFLSVAFLNGDRSVTNVIVSYGPIYYFSGIFILLGVLHFLNIKKNSSNEKNIGTTVLCCWLIAAAFAGIVTNGVSVNRINIIFYALVAVASLGIEWVIRKKIWLGLPIGLIYAGLFLSFLLTYFGSYAELTRYYYADEYLQALNFAKSIECDVYVIDPNPIDRDQTGVIITSYAHDLDSKYMQGKTTICNGVERLPYEERYRFEKVSADSLGCIENDNNKHVFVVKAEESSLFSDEEYDKNFIYADYFVITERE